MRHRTFLKLTGLGSIALAMKLGAKTRMPASRPNILLVMTDQQIADGYSAKSGSRYLNTPAMDALARRSRVYECAYSPNPICMPARTSIWSGRYPHETGIQTNGKAIIDPAEFPTLGTVFSRAGYETGYVGKWHAAYPVNEPAAHGFQWSENMENNGNGLDPATPAAASKFIKREHEKPWLLVVSFNNPHNICEWARGHALPDGDVGKPPPLEKCPPWVANHEPAQNEPDIMAQIRQSYHNTTMSPVGGFGEKEWREYLWAYYRMIEKVDRQVGEVLQSLEDSGQVEDTLVVFTSDHGDMMGAHRWNQKTVFYDEAVRVPLFLSMPGKIKPGPTKALVNTGIDLFPTFCDVAGIPVPAQLPGISLLKENNDREYIVSQNHLVQGAEVDGQKPEPAGRMVRSARYKYCAYDQGRQREELYDMEKDSGETVNQAANPEYKTILGQHRGFLKKWAAAYGDSFPAPGAVE
jgi:arylsulfatase A-like enzyme